MLDVHIRQVCSERGAYGFGREIRLTAAMLSVKLRHSPRHTSPFKHRTRPRHNRRGDISRQMLKACAGNNILNQQNTAGSNEVRESRDNQLQRQMVDHVHAYHNIEVPRNCTGMHHICNAILNRFTG